ncbi:putative THO complex subunit 4 [Hypsibius exemplaris]|uniref:THO complex subunit 4 n=1 Tax=Hypsibius exemplaris TaxID=2072580 RepID=A0A1W0WKY1_HYPEX|nr:putative THO complex subunit 4 [Hypsibius exemplaris]
MADVALDDYIKTKHITRSSGRGGAKTTAGGAGGRTRGAGGARGGKGPQRPQQTSAQRANRFSGAIVKNTQRRSGGGGQNFSRNSGGGGSGAGRWSHDLYGAEAMGGGGGLRSRGGSSGGTKLIISNLDYGVSESDIRDLFSELGDITKGTIHYDMSGRSLGTAEISYLRTGDAVAALKKYNGVPLDGKPMEIQLVGGIGRAIDPAPQRRSLGNQGGIRAGGRLGNAPAGRVRGGRTAAAPARGTRGRRGGARGGGQARTPKVEVTQEQLDMELEEYQSSATSNKMQI